MDKTKQDEMNLYDKIRREADEKRKAKEQEKQKNEEFWKQVKNEESEPFGRSNKL